MTLPASEQRSEESERGEELPHDKNQHENGRIPLWIERHHPVGRGEVHAKDVGDEAARAQCADSWRDDLRVGLRERPAPQEKRDRDEEREIKNRTPDEERGAQPLSLIMIT